MNNFRSFLTWLLVGTLVLSAVQFLLGVPVPVLLFIFCTISIYAAHETIAALLRIREEKNERQNSD